MSAINPASFASTASLIQLPSGLGPGAFTAESGAGPERRQYRTTSNLANIGATPGGYRVPGRFWDSTQEGSNLTQMPLSNSLAQHYLDADFEVRQLDQYPVEYSQSSQQMLGLQSRYDPTAYNLSTLHNPLYATAVGTREGVARTSDTINPDWNHAFQGLSLGS